MDLFDCSSQIGIVTAIGGDEETHRRLVDMGLIGAVFNIKARRRSGMLVDFGDFSATVAASLAKKIYVVER